MYTFPETRGATVLTVHPSGQITEIPIIGWIYTTGVRCDPLFPFPRRQGIGPNEGIRFVDEKGCAVVAVPDRLETMLEDEFYSLMQGLAEAGAFEGATEPTETRTAAPSVVGAPPINFAKDTFKTKSYWSAPSLGILFEIEKLTALPADKRCEKVSRDEYNTLKKDGFQVVDPHDWPPKPGAAEPVSAPEEDSNSSDGMDLI